MVTLGGPGEQRPWAEVRAGGPGVAASWPQARAPASRRGGRRYGETRCLISQAKAGVFAVEGLPGRREWPGARCAPLGLERASPLECGQNWSASVGRKRACPGIGNVGVGAV